MMARRGSGGGTSQRMKCATQSYLRSFSLSSKALRAYGGEEERKSCLGASCAALFLDLAALSLFTPSRLLLLSLFLCAAQPRTRNIASPTTIPKPSPAQQGGAAPVPTAVPEKKGAACLSFARTSLTSLHRASGEGAGVVRDGADARRRAGSGPDEGAAAARAPRGGTRPR